MPDTLFSVLYKSNVSGEVESRKLDNDQPFATKMSKVEIQDLNRSLSETVAWCLESASLTDPRHSLRTEQIRPKERIEFDIVHSREKLNYIKEYTACLDSNYSNVQSTVSKRATLIQKHNVKVVPYTLQNVSGGRLALLESCYVMWDGLSEAESEGFCDDYDNPGWDTWIAYLINGPELARWQFDPDSERGRTDGLLFWIPDMFINLMQGAIERNSSDTLRWISANEVIEMIKSGPDKVREDKEGR